VRGPIRLLIEGDTFTENGESLNEVITHLNQYDVNTVLVSPETGSTKSITQAYQPVGLIPNEFGKGCIFGEGLTYLEIK